ncbi:MAG: hypothetical protein HXX08_09855 [Chloroflexi bacterium]|uniref:Uncharacterized protein n=1 Tax=Candidatus Chlorohelix allophototropha TaxID=3003348 RepID=A0A8T7M2E8_9CHLR|nr:hypothetical protein [Chloroflexota bacterium]WJW65548.1 hypothetical protein OZ401_001315 [Chloroflexota bacterium L227-S17]
MSQEEAQQFPDNEMLANEILDRFRGLYHLLRLSAPSEAVSLEFHRQFDLMGHSLRELCARAITTPGFEHLVNGLTELQKSFAVYLPSESLFHDSPVADTVAPNVLSRLHHRSESDQPPLKVMLASLETREAVLEELGFASLSFDPARWQIVDLGTRVPILVLANRVVEERPNVLVLVMSTGRLIPETLKFIEEVKPRLAGLRLVVVGSALTRVEHLTSRLSGVAYSPDPLQAAELATLSLGPLTGMNNVPLRLELSQSEEDMDSPIKSADSKPETEK